MQRYILRRAILMVPTLIGVTLLVFVAVRVFLPGDVIQMVAGTNAVITDEVRQEIRKDLGLDRPYYEQYWDWVSGVFRADLGESLYTHTPVASEMKNRWPVTIELGLLALMVSLCISLPIGVLAAVRQDSLLDYIARSTAIGFLAIPGFWLGTLVVVLAAKWWGVATPSQYVDLWVDPWQNLKIMLFPFGKFVPVGPAVILGIGMSGTVMRLTRAQMLEVLRQDYIRTAWSKGLRERTVVTRHAIRNAFIPVVTVVGLQLPFVLSGSIIMETIFNIPGMGRFLVTALANLDYPSIQAINLLLASMVVISNLLVDVTYSMLDPRVRYA
jgi:peptide/nickel transport system permease protein